MTEDGRKLPILVLAGTRGCHGLAELCRGLLSDEVAVTVLEIGSSESLPDFVDRQSCRSDPILDATSDAQVQVTVCSGDVSSRSTFTAALVVCCVPPEGLQLELCQRASGLAADSDSQSLCGASRPLLRGGSAPRAASVGGGSSGGGVLQRLQRRLVGSPSPGPPPAPPTAPPAADAAAPRLACAALPWLPPSVLTELAAAAAPNPGPLPGPLPEPRLHRGLVLPALPRLAFVRMARPGAGAGAGVGADGPGSGVQERAEAPLGVAGEEEGETAGGGEAVRLRLQGAWLGLWAAGRLSQSQGRASCGRRSSTDANASLTRGAGGASTSAAGGRLSASRGRRVPLVGQRPSSLGQRPEPLGPRAMLQGGSGPNKRPFSDDSRPQGTGARWRSALGLLSESVWSESNGGSASGAAASSNGGGGQRQGLGTDDGAGGNGGTLSSPTEVHRGAHASSEGRAQAQAEAGVGAGAEVRQQEAAELALMRREVLAATREDAWEALLAGRAPLRCWGTELGLSQEDSAASTHTCPRSSHGDRRESLPTTAASATAQGAVWPAQDRSADSGGPPFSAFRRIMSLGTGPNGRGLVSLAATALGTGEHSAAAGSQPPPAGRVFGRLLSLGHSRRQSFSLGAGVEAAEAELPWHSSVAATPPAGAPATGTQDARVRVSAAGSLPPAATPATAGRVSGGGALPMRRQEGLKAPAELPPANWQDVAEAEAAVAAAIQLRLAARQRTSSTAAATPALPPPPPPPLAQLPASQTLSACDGAAGPAGGGDPLGLDGCVASLGPGAAGLQWMGSHSDKETAAAAAAALLAAGVSTLGPAAAAAVAAASSGMPLSYMSASSLLLGTHDPPPSTRGTAVGSPLLTSVLDGVEGDGGGATGGTSSAALASATAPPNGAVQPTSTSASCSAGLESAPFLGAASDPAPAVSGSVSTPALVGITPGCSGPAETPSPADPLGPAGSTASPSTTSFTGFADPPACTPLPESAAPLAPVTAPPADTSAASAPPQPLLLLFRTSTDGHPQHGDGDGDGDGPTLAIPRGCFEGESGAGHAPGEETIDPAVLAARWSLLSYGEYTLATCVPGTSAGASAGGEAKAQHTGMDSHLFGGWEDAGGRGRPLRPVPAAACSQAVSRYGALLTASAGWRCTELYDMHDALLLSKLTERRDAGAPGSGPETGAGGLARGPASSAGEALVSRASATGPLPAAAADTGRSEVDWGAILDASGSSPVGPGGPTESPGGPTEGPPGPMEGSVRASTASAVASGGRRGLGLDRASSRPSTGPLDRIIRSAMPLELRSGEGPSTPPGVAQAQPQAQTQAETQAQAQAQARSVPRCASSGPPGRSPATSAGAPAYASAGVSGSTSGGAPQGRLLGNIAPPARTTLPTRLPSTGRTCSSGTPYVCRRSTPGRALHRSLAAASARGVGPGSSGGGVLPRLLNTRPQGAPSEGVGPGRASSSGWGRCPDEGPRSARGSEPHPATPGLGVGPSGLMGVGTGTASGRGWAETLEALRGAAVASEAGSPAGFGSGAVSAGRRSGVVVSLARSLRKFMSRPRAGSRQEGPTETSPLDTTGLDSDAASHFMDQLATNDTVAIEAALMGCGPDRHTPACPTPPPGAAAAASESYASQAAHVTAVRAAALSLLMPPMAPPPTLPSPHDRMSAASACSVAAATTAAASGASGLGGSQGSRGFSARMMLALASPQAAAAAAAAAAAQSGPLPRTHALLGPASAADLRSVHSVAWPPEGGMGVVSGAGLGGQDHGTAQGSGGCTGPRAGSGAEAGLGPQLSRCTDGPLSAGGSTAACSALHSAALDSTSGLAPWTRRSVGPCSDARSSGPAPAASAPEPLPAWPHQGWAPPSPGPPPLPPTPDAKPGPPVPPLSAAGSGPLPPPAVLAAAGGLGPATTGPRSGQASSCSGPRMPSSRLGASSAALAAATGADAGSFEGAAAAATAAAAVVTAAAAWAPPPPGAAATGQPLSADPSGAVMCPSACAHTSATAVALTPQAGGGCEASSLQGAPSPLLPPPRPEFCAPAAPLDPRVVCEVGSEEGELEASSSPLNTGSAAVAAGAPRAGGRSERLSGLRSPDEASPPDVGGPGGAPSPLASALQEGELAGGGRQGSRLMGLLRGLMGTGRGSASGGSRPHSRRSSVHTPTGEAAFARGLTFEESRLNASSSASASASASAGPGSPWTGVSCGAEPGEVGPASPLAGSHSPRGLRARSLLQRTGSLLGLSMGLGGPRSRRGSNSRSSSQLSVGGSDITVGTGPQTTAARSNRHRLSITDTAAGPTSPPRTGSGGDRPPSAAARVASLGKAASRKLRSVVGSPGGPGRGRPEAGADAGGSPRHGPVQEARLARLAPLAASVLAPQ
ncbi:hypothetical protein HYH03_017450 [Edaphochlamys debaryana]|uniref:Uncharacterized protein n=1 Tax=Edaphochlamys debaryana TaxID=47281 RepID=A0A836BPA9_9CHLO|nr:hypothetical protein HYH03_017450 [Edaphochlamys debaryana]|eukprot:KAG2483732.1 hypothetical protein HYH03_017450 [Edaphochlamys debaryana]